jgi:hypothetical protein
MVFSLCWCGGVRFVPPRVCGDQVQGEEEGEEEEQTVWGVMGSAGGTQLDRDGTRRT